MIKALQEIFGRWYTEDSLIEKILLEHFQSLFTTNSFNTHLIISISFNTLNPTHFQTLSSPTTNQEIFKATSQLNKWKAPGPDDIPFGLFMEN